jgi:hypothetical protein
MYENKFYEEHKADVWSQNGEDGVVQAMLRILNVQKGWVCEFGAWDGKMLSNTFALVEKGFKAVHIEADPEKFKDLQKTCQSYPNIVPVLAVVSHDPESKFSLDNILARTDIDENFVLLSIDIDGFDYQVWRAFVKYRPRIVIIEINSSVEPDVADWIHENGKREGTSFQPMLKLALQKDYVFLCHTGNMVFVCKEDAASFRLPTDPFACFRRNWITKT